MQVSLLVEDQPRCGTRAVGAVDLRTEAVEDYLLSFGSELEYDAAIVGPAVVGRRIQVSLLVEDEPCDGSVPVGAVGLRTEAVEDCILAFGSELEYDAASVVEAVGVVAPTVVGRPIQVSLSVKNQSRCGVPPVGATALRTKTVKDRILAFRSQFEYDAAVGGPAQVSRPVQVSFLVEDQPCKGLCSIGSPGERVQHSLLAFWRELEYDATPVTAVVVLGPAVPGRPVQVSFLIEDNTGRGKLAIDAGVLRTEAV